MSCKRDLKISGVRLRLVRAGIHPHPLWGPDRRKKFIRRASPPFLDDRPAPVQ